MSNKEAKSLVYIITGDPVPLARHRHGNGRTWDPQKQMKLHWGLMIAEQHGNRPHYTGPLQLDIVYYMPIPKTSKARTEALEGTPQYSRPDADNLLKMSLDTCNGVIFKDDAMFAIIHAKKVYSSQPRTEFTITELSKSQIRTWKKECKEAELRRIEHERLCEECAAYGPCVLAR